MEQYEASQQLDAAAQKILADKFHGDGSKYAEALSLASQQNREAADAFATATNLPWAPDRDEGEELQPTQGRAMDAAARKVLAQKFGNDMSKYPEALLEAKQNRPDLFATYAGLVDTPDTTAAPAYTRLLPADLQAKSRLDAPVSAYPTQPGIANPKDYDPRGLLESVVLTDVARRATAMAFWNGQFRTAADVVRFMLTGHAGAGQVAIAGPTNQTAVSGARMQAK